jgi:thiol-disulfide isomerase/thioredoxin
MQVPAHVNTIIIVFAMDGCGHCDEFKPRFRRIARSYPDVGALVVDANEGEANALAQKYGIDGTPTMLIMRKGTAQTYKVDGAVSDAAIHNAFRHARSPW